MMISNLFVVELQTRLLLMLINAVFFIQFFGSRMVDDQKDNAYIGPLIKILATATS